MRDDKGDLVMRIVPGAATFLGCALALAACAGGGAPSASPSGSSTAPPTPSVTASTATAASSPTAPEGRNPDMGAQEASLRASLAQTGESWLTDPVQLDTPSWAADDAFWNTGVDELAWFRVGTRDGNDILQHGIGGETVEVAADGTPTWIPFPFPWQATTVVSWAPEIASDPDVYYDSLAAPATADLDGLQVSLRGPWLPLLGSWQSEQVATVDAWTVDRFTQDPYVSWGTDPGWSTYAQMLENVAYGRGTATGGWYDAPPTRPAWEDIAWADGYGTTAGQFVDLFDVACGPYTMPTWNILLTDPVQSDWVQAGTVDGSPVYAMATTSTLAELMYGYYSEDPNGMVPDAQALSLVDYARSPAVLAMPAGDGSGWWLLLDQSLSLRAWC
ncbi:hypothetical protein [Demequina capsici]|uniref:Uncharacterized protein n=1 Tax=Demequina capsici TaxID=3075620 RepID=A0AA96J7B1_9MICO|nr:hypothetical protein [Demequina sp. OYTSA14]WNM25032.1 hypothetical protein RN606_02475 [Demequina sp. OYTSA14]